MHCACGIGEERRAVVCLPARKVRVEILERRTAFLGTLVDEVVRAAEVIDERRSEEKSKVLKLGNHIADAAVLVCIVRVQWS